MDKSEGTDFFSKTFSKVTERVARWYQSSQKRVSIAALRRAKNEKLLSLGLKTFELIAADKPAVLEALREDFEAVTRLNREIAQEEAQLNTINGLSNELQRDFSAPAGKTENAKTERKRKSDLSMCRPTKKAYEKKREEDSGAPKKRGRKKNNNPPLAVEDKSAEKADPRLLPMERENTEE